MRRKYSDDIPSLKDLIIPLLKTMSERPIMPIHRSLIDENVIAKLNIQNKKIKLKHLYNTNRTEIQYRLAWVRSHLKKLGVVNSDGKGNWSLTNPDINFELEKNCKDVIEKYRLFTNSKYKRY